MKWFDRFTLHFPQALPMMRRIVALEQIEAGESHEAITLKATLAELRARYEDLADDQLGTDALVIEHRRRMEAAQ